MGCFLGCFGSSEDVKAKRRRHIRKRSDCTRLDQQSVTVQDNSTTVLSSSSQVKVKPEEQLNLNASPRKKVTFDANVKLYEPVLVDDEVDDLQLEISEGGEEESLAESSSSQLKSCSEESSVTSKGSYSTNHRYQNCRDSDDEDGDMDYWDSNLTDEDDDDDADEDGDADIGEEYDGFGEDFEDGQIKSKLRIDANQVYVEEVEDPNVTIDRDVRTIGLNSNARDRSVYVHPVLNPVENLTQWKVLKAKRAPPLKSQKENHASSQESPAELSAQPSLKEPSFRLKSETVPPKKLNQEIAVDASLSNWLASSETTPIKKDTSVTLFADTPQSSRGSNSVISYEDRPILGALTVEELKQFSVSSSPRKSPIQSPNDRAIIGTVGTYWNVIGSAEDSGSATSFRGITQSSKYKRGTSEMK